MSLRIIKLLVIFLKMIVAVYGEGEVVQSGQPTHFHMEDRGPEIQVTADAEGVKINAKPAGLNVVAKPGHIPATIPHSQFVSSIDDIHHTPLENSRLHSILQPASYEAPRLVQHGVEPVAYTAPIDGLAHIGETAHYFNENMPSVNMPVPLPPINYMDAFQQFFGGGRHDQVPYHHSYHHHHLPRHRMYHRYNHHHYHHGNDYDDDNDDDDDYDYDW